MEKYIYHYKSEEGEDLEVSFNFETTPPKEMIYNQKKFYLI